MLRCPQIVPQELLHFLDACMLKQRLPDAAFEKFEELSSKQLEGLHKLVKDLQVLSVVA